MDGLGSYPNQEPGRAATAGAFSDCAISDPRRANTHSHYFHNIYLFIGDVDRIYVLRESKQQRLKNVSTIEASKQKIIIPLSLGGVKIEKSRRAKKC